MFASLLIANRGEIACRIIRTANRMALRTIAVFSEEDAGALHVAEADEAHLIGPARASESYLNINRIIEVAKASKADAVHPGYGFLSENAEFAKACAKAGIAFVGPPVAAMRLMGRKDDAKAAMKKSGIPVVPGFEGRGQDAGLLQKEAKSLGFPVMIKAVAGGGGRGMRLVKRAHDFKDLLESARREAEAAFGDGEVLLEKAVLEPRHIEVQIFADAHGNAVHLFERDCSLQRRHQKVIEEAPAPRFPARLRARICESAVQAARAVKYTGAGTVEFLLQGGELDDESPFYFLEMNTRLQVEHPVTEAITGLDLVEWQLRVAAGEELPLGQTQIVCDGAAIEARICAEDPAQDFRPTAALIFGLQWPQGDGVRVDTGVRQGDAVSPHYDSLITKIIAHGPDRKTALKRLSSALEATLVAGPKTNLGLLHGLASAKAIKNGDYDTSFIERNLTKLIGKSVSPAALAVGAEAFLARRNEQSERRRNRHSQEPRSPWSSADGFVLGQRNQRVLTLLVDGENHDFMLAWHAGNPKVMAVGGVDVSNRPVDLAVRVVDAGAGLIVVEHFAQSDIAMPENGQTNLDVDSTGGTVTSPLHGHLAKLYVGQGDKVCTGDPIAVLEAMKMEHVLRAPCSGIIEAVASSEGDQLAQGAIVAQISQESGEGA
jgi:3-methylcrotonyl-CoA carboxylase alpha subunit